MITTLIIIVITLLILIVMFNAFYPYGYYGDDSEEEVIHTTTTTTTTTVHDDGVAQPGYIISGNLIVQREGNQEFVIDPADGDKVWVNIGDDMYQDGADKIWNLVRV